MKLLKQILVILFLFTLISCKSNPQTKEELDAKTQKVIVNFNGIQSYGDDVKALINYSIENDEDLDCDLKLPNTVNNNSEATLKCNFKNNKKLSSEKRIIINNLITHMYESYPYTNETLPYSVFSDGFAFNPDYVAILKEFYTIKNDKNYGVEYSSEKIGDINNFININKYESYQKHKGQKILDNNIFIAIYETMSNDSNFNEKQTFSRKYLLAVYTDIFRKVTTINDQTVFSLIEMNLDDYSYIPINDFPKPTFVIFADDIDTLKKNIPNFDKILVAGIIYDDLKKINPFSYGVSNILEARPDFLNIN